MHILSKEDFDKAVLRIQKYSDELTFDLETTGLDIWNEHELCGIGICIRPERGVYETFYFPFRHKDQIEMPLFAAILDDNPLNLPIEYLSVVIQLLMNAGVLIGHNIKFDLAGIQKEGFKSPDNQRFEDTMVSARLYLKARDAPLNLEYAAKHIIGFDDEKWKQDFKAYLRKHKIKDFSRADPRVLGAYCEKDAQSTFMIRDKVLEFVEETGQQRIYDQESGLCKVLFEMESEGLFFDRDYCEAVIPRIEEKLKQIETRIYELTKEGTDGEIERFDIGSTKQLNTVLNKMGHVSPVISEAGNPKWGLSQILGLGTDFGDSIIEYRGIEKMRNTYFAPLLKWKDDRLHPNFKSAGTVTGRMACSNPNLQNISNKIQNLVDSSVDEEQLEAIKAMMGAQEGVKVTMGTSGGLTLGGMLSYGKKLDNDENNVSVRRLYVAPPDFEMWFIDFSQMEMRVFSDYVGDETVLEALEAGTFDFHDYVTEQVWGIDKTNNLWGFYRNLAKAINFGLVYGIGNKKLSAQIQKTEEEAAEYRRGYFSRFPKAERFIREVSRTVETRGWIKNRFGRRYWIDADRAYVGVNYLVQGSSADIVKNRMLAIQEFIKKEKLRSRLIIQVHDELDFYIHKSEREVIREFQRIMEERQIKAFLATDVSIGTPSWGQKEKVCTKCLTINGAAKNEPHICGAPENKDIDLVLNSKGQYQANLHDPHHIPNVVKPKRKPSRKFKIVKEST